MSLVHRRPRNTLARLSLFAGLLAASLTMPVAGHVTAQEGGPSLEIVSPAPGAVVTTDAIDVEVKVNNFDLNCAEVGRPDADGTGHVHVMLDGMTMATLTNFYCSETFSISGVGVAPGKHMLIIDLASNTHMDMMETAQQVEFEYQPANPVGLPEANDQGEPGVELVSDLAGATVPSTFDIEVRGINFTASEDLEGKQNVPGYGHYHVFVDTPMDMMAMDEGDDMSMESTEEDEMEMSGTPEGDMGDMGGEMAMMSMAGMVLMPGSDTFTLDLSAWGPGEHTIWIEPVQNDHTMFEAFGHVEFTVIVAEGDAGSSTTAIDLVDIAFNPAEVALSAGTDQELTLTNTGAAPHNFSIDELGISVDLQSGESTTVTVNGAAGTYAFYCNVPGHREAGMEGTLTLS